MVTGRPITIVRGDAAETAAATAEAKRLLEQAKVACVFGSYAAAVALAASAVTELAGMPYFELDALADAVTERGLKLIGGHRHVRAISEPGRDFGAEPAALQLLHQAADIAEIGVAENLRQKRTFELTALLLQDAFDDAAQRIE